MTVDAFVRAVYARLAAAAVLSVITVSLTGCSAGSATPSAPATQAAGGPPSSSSSSSSAASTPSRGSVLARTVQALVPLPTGHVLAATSNGLFNVAPDGSSTRVGTTQFDLTSLARDGDGTLYTSGHDNPTAGSRALGLLRSTDNGAVWTVVAGQGRLDLHALAVRGTTLVATSDDELVVSRDGGKIWQPGAPIAADSLTLDTTTLWVTSSEGLARSGDDGTRLQRVADAPSLRWGALATDRTVWGIDTVGRVWRRDSPDAWRAITRVPVDRVTAFTALDAHRAVVATGAGLTWIADSRSPATTVTA